MKRSGARARYKERFIIKTVFLTAFQNASEDVGTYTENGTLTGKGLISSMVSISNCYEPR